MLRKTRRTFLGPLLLFACLEVSAPSPFAQSTDSDSKQGAEVAAQVVLTHGLYESPQLQKFLDQLGSRLVERLGDQPFTYRFAITDEIEPNAYALPGGYIFATRNIFAVSSSEAELAGIIGHEIIHSHRRHAVKAANRSILPSILAVPGALVGVFNQEAGKILSAPSTLAMARYGRKQETEADDLASNSRQPRATIRSRSNEVSTG